MRIAVAMVEPKTPGNIGSVARIMKNFNAGSLHLINPRCELDDDARGHAMHGVDILDQARIISGSGKSTVDDLAILAREHDLVAGTAGKTGNPMKLFRVPVDPSTLATMAAGRDVLVVLGREDTGLTDAELRACDVVVSIDASKTYPSLNVSHAAAIILHQLFKASGGGPRIYGPASRDRRARFHEWFAGTIGTACKGMTEPWRLDNFIQVVKNVIERSGITGRELDIIEGFVRTAMAKASTRE